MSAGFLNQRSRTMWRQCLRASPTIGVMLLLGACGNAASRKHAVSNRHSTAPRICEPAALDVMAHFLAVHAQAIATATSTGNDAMPQCSFTTALPGDKRLGVIVNVNTAPSPYFVLERTTIEATQVFGPTQSSSAPVSITGLGLEAAWFPTRTALMATDGIRLITTSVEWPHASQMREITLARTVTRPYLKTPHGKAAQALAEGYPSG